MKKVLFAIGLIFFAACSEEEPDNLLVIPPQEDKTFYYPAKGHTIDISVASWGLLRSDYSCDASWVEVVQWEYNSAVLTVTAKPNESTEARTAKIIITKENSLDKEFVIYQFGKNALTPTSAPYSVGDIYFENGVAGVVYKVTDNGMHGMIVSLNEAFCAMALSQWAAVATDYYDGMKNMNAVKQVANWEEQYPAFRWCDALNTGGVSGWYLPAIGEMQEELYVGFSGLPSYKFSADADKECRAARDSFNKTLLYYNGDALDGSGWRYKTSSESDEVYGWTIELMFGGPSNYMPTAHTKASNGRVRAVHAF